MIARQSVTIHYRRLSDATKAFGSHSLEGAVRNAMAQRFDGGPLSKHWKRRAWFMPENGGETLLMNLYHDAESYVFGDLTQYTKGYMQALIQEQDEGESLPVEQEPPPSGKEYIHSMMYWMAVGNHFLAIQSRSLTCNEAEKYLTWLLKDRTATIANSGQVIFQFKFDTKEVGGDLNDIQEIVVGGTASAFAPTVIADSGQEAEAYHSIGTKRPWHERAIEVLKAVMASEADVKHLLESIPEEANLEVSVHIGYKSKKRNVSRAPMQVALRNLPEGDVRARGRQGTLTNGDVRLSYRANVLKNGSLLNPEDAARALSEAYKYFVDNGKIEP